MTVQEMPLFLFYDEIGFDEMDVPDVAIVRPVGLVGFEQGIYFLYIFYCYFI